MSRNFWQFILSNLQRGERVVLMIVSESTGSSPGRIGFKMAVTQEELYGSIGGGVMEVDLVDVAREMLASGGLEEPQTVVRVHQKNSPDASGMICSGSQKVVLVSLDDTNLSFVEQFIEHIQSATTSIWRITRSGVAFSEECGADTEFLYEERLSAKNRLYIVGGGHCALALSETMSRLGFDISLFDDRANLNTVEKNRFANEKRVIESYDRIGGLIPSDGSAFVSVMTLGYAFDAVVIRQLIHHDLKYFGVLGSKAKMKTLLRELEAEGLPPERLSSIRTPIGLPINSHSPEEIAISIAAEIIAVKNGAA